MFTIENPILNSPFRAPRRHFRFNEDGTSADLVEQRRRSSYFIPIPTPKKRVAQKTLDFSSDHRERDNDHINRIRVRVDTWREGNYPGVTPTTRRLLAHWQDPSRDRRLFYCQLEALETIIYLAEVAGKQEDEGLLKILREAAETSGTTLTRRACKMATGSGKTVVMAMIIAWQVLNKRANPRDPRFGDRFLVVAPGITIRDRLRVLLPSDPENYYRYLDVVPVEQRDEIGAARIVVANYHAFKCRDTGDAGGLTKRLLARGQTQNPFLETPDQMVMRVCRELGKGGEVVVLNDEAHHCYRSRPVSEKLSGDERYEANQREEAARLWITGLEAVHAKLGVKMVYDLSATPFYLKGSGYPEGTLFPWVVSDFSLMDAIESGVVKIPRVPVADNTLGGDQPTYRDLWQRIRDGLPRKGRSAEDASAHQWPGPLDGALRSLYDHYRRQYELWQQDAEASKLGHMPPVFIVVCSNTSVSKMVFDWISGQATAHQHHDGSPVVKPGNLELFSNADGNRWRPRPNTILVDSEQLESGEGLSPEFKRLAAHQIDDFKAEYRQRYPDRDASALTDEDLMREVLNTVGKPGKLGEQVRCVVSVSMLTEGWDVNSVTHILGVRAFGTQLLCEQVVGRGLRRMNYSVNDQGHFEPEYADVYGVPFAFLPVASGLPNARGPMQNTRPGRIQAIPERARRNPVVEITYPRVVGYRYVLEPTQLHATFTPQSRLVLSTADIPTRTENAPIVGESTDLIFEDLPRRRMQEVIYNLAQRVLQSFYPATGGDSETVGYQVWLFPQLVEITRRWIAECLELKDDVFPQMLLLAEKGQSAAEKIARAILASSPTEQRVRAVLQASDVLGSTAGVSFDSCKPYLVTDPTKCHINLLPYDSDWERLTGQKLEELAFVKSYVKNQGLGFRIPYSHEGWPGNYYPDFLVRVDDGQSDLLNLIVEISGQKKEDKEAKVNTATTCWIPAINSEKTFGRWDYLEITDPMLTKRTLTEFLRKPT